MAQWLTCWSPRAVDREALTYARRSGPYLATGPLAGYTLGGRIAAECRKFVSMDCANLSERCSGVRSLGCALFLSLALFSAATAAEPAQRLLSLTPGELQFLSAHPTVRIAPDPDFPPIEFLDQRGLYQGIAADYLHLVAPRLGIEFEVVKLASWDEVLRQARSREIDMLGAASESPQRAEFMNFTAPYIRLPGVILARNDTDDELTLDMLRGKRVGVVSGYVWQDLISNDYPDFALTGAVDAPTGLKQLSLGALDAMIMNLATASWHIEREGITNLRMAGETGYFGEYAFAIRNDWPKLASALAKALAEITPEEHNEVLRKWINLTQPQSAFDRTLLRYVALALGVVLVLALAILGWNRALRSLVNQRTAALNVQLKERELAEKALEQSRRQLENRVRERTAELEERNQQLIDEVKRRKQTQDRLNRFKTTLDRTLDCVFIFDSEALKFLYVNEGGIAQVGYSREELLDMSPATLTPEFSEAKFREFIESLKDEDCIGRTFETVHETKDGNLIPAEIFLQYIAPKDEPPRFVAIVRDVTERKAIQAKLSWNHAQNDIIIKAQTAFITKTDPRASFDLLLSGLLHLTDSEYGFIGEVLYSAEGQPYLRTQAITNIAWDEATRKFYEEHAPKGMAFRNLNTLFGAAMRTGAPVIANSPATDDRRGGIPPGHPPLNSFLGLPLYAAEQMVGLAGVANRAEGYGEDLIESLTPFLITCSSLISEYRVRKLKTQAEERVKNSEERMRAVLSGVLESIVTIGRGGIVESVNAATEGIFGYSPDQIIGQNVSMLMPEPDRSAHDQYLERYHSGTRARVVGQEREVMGRHRDGSPIALNLGINEIRVGGEIKFVGVLRDISEWKRNEAALIQARTELQRANEKLKEQAREDALTGIGNRRRFDEVLDQETRRVTRGEKPLSLILCDVDHFKSFNDTHGHLEGDECLRRVAQAIKQCFPRGGDLVARYGGEEFGIILVATDAPSALAMAEKLTREIWELHLPHKGGPIDGRVTVSAGVSTATAADIADAETLVTRADEALYRAKAQGRNRVARYVGAQGARTSQHR